MNAYADVRYLPHARFEQVDTRFDRELGIYWAWMNPKPRPYFSGQLLSELSSYVDTIENGAGTMTDAQGERGDVRYTVIASKAEGVFNLGGDLALFKSAILARDRATLVHYGRSCVDTLHRWWRNCGLPLTTISLVQGEALGGGFECALASSVIIAEEDARMGFPEILFNLFPGMGAWDFTIRKAGYAVANEMILSGRLYSAEELHHRRLVDVVAEDGEGEAAIERVLHEVDPRHRGTLAALRAQRLAAPIRYETLTAIVERWAESALGLTDRDLRLMERLARAQARKAGGADEGAVEELKRMELENAWGERRTGTDRRAASAGDRRTRT